MSTKPFEVEKIEYDLELDEDIPSHQNGWLYQRIGLSVIFIFVIAAALGVFGSGPLSNATAVNNGDTLYYERFARHENILDLDFILKNRQDSTVIAIPTAYLTHFKLESITPEAETNRIENNHLVYTFKTNHTSSIRFYLLPREVGSVAGSIIVNGRPFNLSHFIYP